jgi:hypothetical protein
MDYLPIPQSKKGWIYAMLLILASFLIYYSYFYHELETTYYAHYWNNSSYPLNEADLKVDIFMPRFLSSLVEREASIRIYNMGEIEYGNVIIALSLQKPLPSGWVLMCPTQSVTSTGCDNGSNTISFASIPRGATVTSNFWISVKNIDKGLLPYNAFISYCKPGEIQTDDVSTPEIRTDETQTDNASITSCKLY